MFCKRDKKDKIKFYARGKVFELKRFGLADVEMNFCGIVKIKMRKVLST